MEATNTAVLRRRARELLAAENLDLTDEWALRPVGGAGEIDPDLRRDLEAVLALAARKLALVERVATLSRRAHQRSRELSRRLQLHETPSIVAISAAMKSVLRAAELVAPHPTTVLLRGESGTGKELLASHIHRTSLVASGPFVAVNCGALPDSIIESELFGHEKGAFTGALAARRGRFEMATGGTLFLDEIAELRPAAQVKVLRALQERTIQRVGAETVRSVDVRVIAATHRDLRAMVAEGSFREDLYFRLHVVPITLPPLRQRPEDIQELARRTLARLAARSGQSVGPSEAFLRSLQGQPWPGNVRQLQNEVERAFIEAAGGPLRPIASQPPSHPERTFVDMARRCIEDALTDSRGKIYGPGGAAERLGLKPSTLQTKMRKYGIERASFVR